MRAQSLLEAGKASGTGIQITVGAVVAPRMNGNRGSLSGLDEVGAYRAGVPEASPDLRRRRSREFTQEVVVRAGALPDREAALLKAVFADGKPLTELAALTATPVRRLRRRIHRLMKRVMTPEFAYVMRHAHSWPQTRRRVAHATVVLGQSLRETGRALGLSLHSVRRHHESVRSMCEAVASLAREARAALHART
jgi:DNA-directed RNA polymerase specialized sigma24 family protein